MNDFNSHVNSSQDVAAPDGTYLLLHHIETDDALKLIAARTNDLKLVFHEDLDEGKGHFAAVRCGEEAGVILLDDTLEYPITTMYGKFEEYVLSRSLISRSSSCVPFLEADHRRPLVPCTTSAVE